MYGILWKQMSVMLCPLPLPFAACCFPCCPPGGVRWSDLTSLYSHGAQRPPVMSLDCHYWPSPLGAWREGWVPVARVPLWSVWPLTQAPVTMLTGMASPLGSWRQDAALFWNPGMSAAIVTWPLREGMPCADRLGGTILCPASFFYAQTANHFFPPTALLKQVVVWISLQAAVWSIQTHTPQDKVNLEAAIFHTCSRIELYIHIFDRDTTIILYLL